MNVVFFATSRILGLASIVTAIKFSKIPARAEHPFKISGGGKARGPQLLRYSTPMPETVT